MEVWKTVLVSIAEVMDLSISDSEDIVEEAACVAENSSDSGSLLISFENLRKEMKSLFQNISRHQVRARNQTTEKFKELRVDFDSLKSLIENCSPSVIQEVKTRRIPAMKLQNIEYVAGPDRAVIPLLTWAIIATVMSYVKAMPSLRFWVSDSMWSKMAAQDDVLDQSQGFAMLLFAAKNNAKVKLGTPPGRLWTFFMRRSLRSVIIAGKAKLFCKSDDVAQESAERETLGIPTSAISAVETAGLAKLPMEPEWLARFANSAHIIRAVEEVMLIYDAPSNDGSTVSGTTDTVSEGSLSRLRKRRKRSGIGIATENDLRKHAVKQIRSMCLERMNQGRTSVRAYLYRKPVFILYKIAKIKDVQLAPQQGYEIVLERARSSAETIDKDTPNVSEGIWDIPDACVQKRPGPEKKNVRALEDLEKKFPSLSATIFYKKQVQNEQNEVGPMDETLTNNGREYVSASEKVSFHEIGNEMLMEIFSCEDRTAVRSVSELSLKAVHVLAIALRGLVVTVLDQYSRERTPNYRNRDFCTWY